MNTLRIIIRLYHNGTAIKSIADLVNASRNTIKKYVRIWNTLGISYEEFCSKSEEELSKLFCTTVKPVSCNLKQDELDALLPSICKRLAKKGTTMYQLHGEYLASHPDGYGITQFRRGIRRHLKLSQSVMRIEHKAGDKMFVDYAGDKLHLTLPDGIKQPVEVFVAILGCSQLTYVEAVESQRREDFIMACENTLHFWGGTPLAIVPDNLRSAVTKASRYEAVLNDELTDEKDHPFSSSLQGIVKTKRRFASAPAAIVGSQPSVNITAWLSVRRAAISRGIRLLLRMPSS